MKNKVSEWLKINIGKSFGFVLILSVLGMAASIVELLFVVASKNLVNIATKTVEGSLYGAAVYLAALLFLCLIINSVVSFVDMWLSAHLERKIKSGIFERVIKKDFLSVTSYHTGDILNRIDSDVNVIVSGVVSIIPAFVIFCTLIIGGMVLLYDIAPQLAIVILIMAPIIAVFARIYSKKYKKLHKSVQKKDSKTKSFLLEAMQNILVIKAFGKYKEVHNKSYSLYDNLFRTKMKKAYLSLIANAGMFLFFNAGYYLAFFYAVFLINVGVLVFGDLIAILQLVSNIQEPFKSVSSLVPQYFSLVASVERILEIEELPEDEKGDRKLEDFEKIVFDNVTFEYDDTDKIENISFVIEKGQFATITGRSGSGKTTILKLLMAVITPKSGRVYFETKDGEVQAKDVCGNVFSYVPQGNLLMSGTVCDNVSFFEENPDSEKVQNALKVANVWEYVSGLEDGINSVIGENGEGLSEGQAQRIAIARAIYHDAKIIVLDEATSALDDETERRVLSDIAKNTDKTLIAVTHRKAATEMSGININIAN